MTDMIQTPAAQALAWALVHFTWQGAAIGFVAFIAFRIVRSSASLRYAMGVGALVAMLAAPAATFFALLEAPRPAGTIDETAPAAGATGLALVAGAVSDDRATTLAAPRMPSIRLSPEALAVAVAAWLTGVTFFSLRLFGGWIVARRMVRQSVRPAADHIQVLALRVADRLALRRVVAVLESSAVAVPVMVGWLKPTIVLPIAALAGLTPTQVEALIAHELAHVLRHDYLVNLLQSFAEVMLFYHPAVWWLSRRVRTERELCCDDLAVGVCDPLVYATALTDLASMTSPRVALAATDGDLLGRVRRILGHSETPATTRGSIMSGLAFGLVATIAVPVALISAAQAPRQAHPHVPVSHPAVPHTPPDVVRLEGRASVHMEPGHPTSLVFDHMNVQQTTQPADQKRLELERRIEELKRQLAAELDKKQVAAELTMKHAEAQHVKNADVRRQAMDEAAVEFEKVARANHALRATVADGQAQAATEAELAAARRRYEEARQLFEKGLTSRTQLLEAEAALAKLQARGNADATAAIELQRAKEQLARAAQLVEKGLMTARDLAALEVQVANAEQRLLASRTAERTRDVRAAAEANTADARRLHQLLAERTAAVAHEQDAALLERLSRLTVDIEAQAVAATEPARVGDTLRITIEGEPELPSSYRVRDDGTIRLPFVGVLKVSGLTAAQVREAVGKQLSDRKLGSVSQVRVTLARPRVRESRNIKIDVEKGKDAKSVEIKRVR